MIQKYKSADNSRWNILKKMFFSLAVTGAVTEFSLVGASFIDGLITTNFLGSNAIAAIGIVSPIIHILNMLSGTIATGMETVCTSEIGRGNIKNMNRYFSVSVLAGFSLSLLIVVIMLANVNPIVRLLGANGKAIELSVAAADYFFGISFVPPAIFMVAILTPTLQIDSGQKTIQIGAIINSVINIVLDFIAVKLNMGLMGIAFSTSIAYYVHALFLCTHFLKKDSMLRIVRPNISVREFSRMLSYGYGKALKRASSFLRPYLLNVIIISYAGTKALSALSIHNSLSNFTNILLSGIAEAVGLLTALYYGEVNEEGINEVNRNAGRAIAITSGLACLLLIIFSEPLSGLYIHEESELKQMVRFSIIMLGLENPLLAIIYSRIKYLQAVRKKRSMNLLIIGSRLIFVVIGAYILGSIFGSYGILSAFAFGNLLSVISVLVFHQIRTGKIRLTGKDILALPDEFDLDKKDVISTHVRNSKDISLTAEQISLFCKEHNFSNRLGYYSSLTFEELANNIITHGFPQNKSTNLVIDLRLVANSDRMIMRISDNCPMFNLTKKIEEIRREKKDPTRNLGIRITAQIAKNIQYTHTFDTNNVIIEYIDNEISDRGSTCRELRSM